MATQSAAERAWLAISRFYDNCQKKLRGKRDFLSSRKMLAQLNIKLADGNFRKPEKLLPFLTKKVSEL
ncbi:hypothetical protein [Limnospira platensis]|uniref:hypothetical protein n=1 Tax=Limnospira platensis TaxID=118562 RepID=UPI00288A5E71